MFLNLTSRAVVVAATFVALALGGTAMANAESVKFNATKGQLETACNKVGGQYHQSPDSGNYYCVTNTGVAGCNLKGSCSYSNSDPAARPTGPTIPQQVATAGVAG